MKDKGDINAVLKSSEVNTDIVKRRTRRNTTLTILERLAAEANDSC